MLTAGITGDNLAPCDLLAVGLWEMPPGSGRDRLDGEVHQGLRYLGGGQRYISDAFVTKSIWPTVERGFIVMEGCWEVIGCLLRSSQL